MKNEHPTPGRGDAEGRSAEPGNARSALDWARETGGGENVIQGLSAHLRRRRQRRLAVAGAGVAAFVVAAALWISERRMPNEPAAAGRMIVQRPEIRRLPDGSAVELKPGAEIAVDFDEAVRHVTLHRGEAHFDVAKNPARPFVVKVGTVEVRAVGTAFSVELGQAAVAVLVTEGRVAVERRAEPGSVAPTELPQPAAALALVESGNRVVVDLADKNDKGETRQPMPVIAVTTQEMEQRLAWRVPRVEFMGSPLADVVRTMNRHGRTQIVLGDSKLEALQVSGILRADNTDALLRLLEREFGLKAVSRDGEIVLSR